MEKLFTAKEVAEYCRVKVATVWSWFRNGKLKYIEFGRKKLVKESDLVEFINGGGNNGK